MNLKHEMEQFKCEPDDQIEQSFQTMTMKLDEIIQQREDTMRQAVNDDSNSTTKIDFDNLQSLIAGAVEPNPVMKRDQWCQTDQIDTRNGCCQTSIDTDDSSTQTTSTRTKDSDAQTDKVSEPVPPREQSSKVE